MEVKNWEVPAPQTHYAGKHLVDLTITFGGKFVHTPVAKYVGGANITFKGLSGALVGEDHIRGMCSTYGLTNIKGFYHLVDDCFLLVRSIDYYRILFSKAIVKYDCKLTLYVDIPEELPVIDSEDELLHCFNDVEENLNDVVVNVEENNLNDIEVNEKMNEDETVLVEDWIIEEEIGTDRQEKEKGKGKAEKRVDKQKVMVDDDEFYDPVYEWEEDSEHGDDDDEASEHGDEFQHDSENDDKNSDVESRS